VPHSSQRDAPVSSRRPRRARARAAGDFHPSLIVRSCSRRTLEGMEDLTRFGLTLLSVPVAVVTGGVILGLIGRWITGRRGG